MPDLKLHNEVMAIAVAALTRIETHENVCAQRYGMVIKLLIAMVGGSLAVLLSIVGFLVSYIVNHHV